jgi:hypothetical protein
VLVPPCTMTTNFDTSRSATQTPSATGFSYEESAPAPGFISISQAYRNLAPPLSGGSFSASGGSFGQIPGTIGQNVDANSIELLKQNIQLVQDNVNKMAGLARSSLAGM